MILPRRRSPSRCLNTTLSRQKSCLSFIGGEKKSTTNSSKKELNETFSILKRFQTSEFWASATFRLMPFSSKVAADGKNKVHRHIPLKFNSSSPEIHILLLRSSKIAVNVYWGCHIDKIWLQDLLTKFKVSYLGEWVLHNKNHSMIIHRVDFKE